MIKITVSPRVSTALLIQNIIDKPLAQMAIELDIVGKAVHEKTKAYINATATERRGAHSGDLAASLTYKFYNFGKRMGFNIGKVSKLPIYWEVVNYGGYVPPTLVGSFWGNSPEASKAGNGNEKFIPDRGGYLMKPSSPIRPMNYISYGYTIAKLLITKVFQKQKRRGK